MFFFVSLKSISSSSIESYSKHSPLPSTSTPSINSSPESFFTHVTTGSALSQLRDQLKLDEELKLQNEFNSRKKHSNNSSTSSNELIIGGSKKLKKTRPAIITQQEEGEDLREELEEQIISDDTFGKSNSPSTTTDTTSTTTDQQMEKEEKEELVSLTTLYLPETNSTSNGLTNLFNRYHPAKESSTYSIIMLPPRITYHLTSSVLLHPITTTQSLLSLPLTIIQSLPVPSPTSSQSTSNNKLALSRPTGARFKLPDAKEIAYKTLEISATIGFLGVLSALAGSGLVWRKVRGGSTSIE